jgi:putative ABC transport system ATP-binding protein
LLHLIAGLEAPTTGSVSVAGRDPSTLNAQARAAWRANEIGFVFQNYRLFPMLTALENVALPLQLAPLPRREHRARARTALKIVGLEAWADQYPEQLSGGQQQRVAIARAIVTDPSVIIADEPTGDLDRRTADHILALFHELNRGFGKTIVMVTHDLIAARHASVIRHLDKGRLVEQPRVAPSSTPAAGSRWQRPDVPSLAKTHHGVGAPSHVEVTKILMLDSAARRR